MDLHLSSAAFFFFSTFLQVSNKSWEEWRGQLKEELVLVKWL